MKPWRVETGDSTITAEFKSVAERISAVPKSLSPREKEEMYLGVFLANTEFRTKEPQVEQLTARAREFAAQGRLVRNGWMLTRVQDERGTSWLLGVAP